MFEFTQEHIAVLASVQTETPQVDTSYDQVPFLLEVRGIILIAFVKPPNLQRLGLPIRALERQVLDVVERSAKRRHSCAMQRGEVEAL